MTAIVGATGEGKSTIINLIMRFYECPPRAIFLNGEDIREYDTKSIRKHMAFVSQTPSLFNDTIRGNIAYGREGISDEEVMKVAKKAHIDDLIESLPEGLSSKVGDMGVMLSGGEKQRIAIARALLKDSDIFLLDEATSALDSGTERKIQEAIDVAVKGKTSIVIAHRLSTIKYADKIVVLEKGRVLEQGSLQELLDEKGKFYEYWQMQKFD